MKSIRTIVQPYCHRKAVMEVVCDGLLPVSELRDVIRIRTGETQKQAV